jgi:hypothetical protein
VAADLLRLKSRRGALDLVDSLKMVIRIAADAASQTNRSFDGDKSPAKSGDKSPHSKGPRFPLSLSV